MKQRSLKKKKLKLLLSYYATVFSRELQSLKCVIILIIGLMEITHCLKISNREDGWWTQYLKSQFSSEIPDFTVGLDSTNWRFISFGM